MSALFFLFILGIAYAIHTSLYHWNKRINNSYLTFLNRVYGCRKLWETIQMIQIKK